MEIPILGKSSVLIEPEKLNNNLIPYTLLRPRYALFFSEIFKRLPESIHALR